jgi:recombination protein RecA
MVDEVPLGEIANRLGYAQDNSVNSIAKKFGIPSRRGSRKDLYNDLYKQMFSDEQEQILLGSLLGDGCILQRTSRNCVYSETHSIHQLDYISWKQKKMYPFIQKVQVGHKQVSAYMKSVALPQLGFYRNVFYPKDDKIVPVESLAWMNELAVAVWYMDDGSISKNNKNIKFSTHGFTPSSVGMLQGWLATKFDIISRVYYDRNYPFLQIMHNSNDKFISLVEPYIIPSMRYKLGQ